MTSGLIISQKLHTTNKCEKPPTMRYILLILLLCSVSHADEVEIILPDIQLPTTPVLVEPITIVPQPKPAPVLEAEVISSIPSDAWYIIESKTQLYVDDVPEGLITIREFDVTQITKSFLGKFVDGNGSFAEERTYPTSNEFKFIYVIRAQKKGTTGLVLRSVDAPVGTKAVKQMLTVMGQAPNPPPDPEPDPEPDPSPDPPPTGIRVLILFEETANREQMNAIYSPEVMQWMIDNCAKDIDGGSGYRRWDKSSTISAGVAGEQETWRKLWDKVMPITTSSNMVFVSTDTKVHSAPITNTQELLTFLNKVKDGK